jgi:hypothetical protein
MTDPNKKTGGFWIGSAVAALTLAVGGSPGAAGDELRVSQIGSPAPIASESGRSATIQQTNATGSRAVVNQRSVPSGDQALEALGLEGESVEFEFYDGVDLSADSGLSEDASADTQSLSGLLETFEQNVQGFGTNNAATVVQRDGANNRALAVQAGSDNRLQTIQIGSGNIGVHLQRRSGNNTILRQQGNNNVNALVAQGGVTGPSGGPVKLNVVGSNVDGFSLRARGRQDYSTVNVRPNATGGLNIDVRR